MHAGAFGAKCRLKDPMGERTFLSWAGLCGHINNDRRTGLWRTMRLFIRFSGGWGCLESGRTRVERALSFGEKSPALRALLFGVVLAFLAIIGEVQSGEEGSLNVGELNRNVIFTENFYLKHVPEALKSGNDEELDGLARVEEGEVSLVPTDGDFAPDLDSVTMTRASAEERSRDKSGLLPAPEEELSLEEEEGGVGPSQPDDADPGSEEQKRMLKHDTQEKKKLLNLRRKHQFKDIPFGPQAPHLAMVDIFGVTGDDAPDPLMAAYGLESRHDWERDMRDFEEQHASVVSPTKFTERKVWGYDAEGRPICSRRQWLEQKLEGRAGPGPADPLRWRQIEYMFSQKIYSTDGFLDELGTFGVKSLLDKFRYKQENKFAERRGKKPRGKLKEPEIVMKEDYDLGKISGPEKHVGWQVTRRAANLDARNRLLKDLDGVTDLSGVIHAMNANSPDKQRKDAEKVFWDFHSKKRQRQLEKRCCLRSLRIPKTEVSFDIDTPSKKTLFGWREVLFDQAMESLGKFDQRAGRRHDTLLGGDQIRGIPPSRIIADMSSEAIRRPRSHHLFQNPFKGFRNIFCKRLEKKYKEYVADVLQLRAEDKTYNELMDLANRYEARQDWLSQFESPWVFIPQGQAIPDSMRSEGAGKDGADARDADEYEKELLALDLDAIPVSDMEVFMSQHIKGDVLFPDEEEAEEAKEAMLRKIARETAEHNENQPYRLPHRPRASRRLPVNDGYNPAEALRQRESLTAKTRVVKQGRVVADPFEKKKLKVLEKGEMRRIEAASDREENKRSLQKAIAQSPGARASRTPPIYRRSPTHKTAFDDFLAQTDT